MFKILQKIQSIDLGFDLNAALDQKSNLFKMINKDTVLQEYSEYNVNNYSVIENIKNRTVYFKHKPNLSESEGVTRIGSRNSNIIYVNGVLTGEDMAMYQTDYLSKVLNRDVELIYNYSGGILVDLLESCQDRSGNKATIASIKTADIIAEKLSMHNEVIVIAHSQGGIITTKAIEILAERLPEVDLRCIKYITFGTGFRNSRIPSYIETEHYANVNDPIPNLGLLRDDCYSTGVKHVRNTSGHLFIADYIHPLMAGEFGCISNIIKFQ